MADHGVLLDMREIRHYAKIDECIVVGPNGTLDEGTVNEHNSQPKEVGVGAGCFRSSAHGSEKIIPLRPDN